MKRIYDTVVIGLGGAGSSTLYHLAKTGQRVLGIEQFNINHNYGSSHGDTRITRQAYFEGNHYIPYLKRAHQIWDDIQAKTKEKIIEKNGGAFIGKENGIVSKCKFSAENNDIEHLYMNSQDFNKKHNFFNIKNPEFYVLYEKQAGMLFPEKCISSFILQAQLKKNVDIQINTNVNNITKNESNNTYHLHTKKCIIETKNVILAGGSWNINLLNIFKNIGGVKLKENFLKIENNFVFYFKFKKPKHDIKDRFPIYIIEDKLGYFYGFPDIGNENGFKISFYKSNDVKQTFTDVTNIDRKLGYEENYKKIITTGKKYINGFNNDNIEFIKHISCLYTCTPDDDFIIDEIAKNAYLVSACSGHGFKFTSVVGELASNLCEKGKSEIPHFKISKYI